MSASKRAPSPPIAMAAISKTAEKGKPDAGPGQLPDNHPPSKQEAEE